MSAQKPSVSFFAKLGKCHPVTLAYYWQSAGFEKVPVLADQPRCNTAQHAQHKETVAAAKSNTGTLDRYTTISIQKHDYQPRPSPASSPLHDLHSALGLTLVELRKTGCFPEWPMRTPNSRC